MGNFEILLKRMIDFLNQRFQTDFKILYTRLDKDLCKISIEDSKQKVILGGPRVQCCSIGLNYPDLAKTVVLMMLDKVLYVKTVFSNTSVWTFGRDIEYKFGKTVSEVELNLDIAGY